MRILILGAGSIGERHLKNLKSLNAEVEICDLRKERLKEIGKKHNVKTYLRMEDALKNNFDAALICTPSNLHAKHAVECAKKGLNLFIEKPLSDKPDVDELARIIKEKNLTSFVACNMRFNKGISFIKKQIDENRIGKITGARIEFGYYLPDWHPTEDYRKGYSANKSMGGGIIFDAIHEIDYAKWFFGKAEKVSCFSGKMSSLEIDTEDYAEILIQFENNVVAEVHLDYLQRAYRRTCQLIGEKGTILWDFNEKKVRIFADKKWLDFEFKEEVNDMYVEEARHFLNCIKGKEKPLSDILSGKSVLEIALSAKESSEKGKVVKLKQLL